MKQGIIIGIIIAAVVVVGVWFSIQREGPAPAAPRENQVQVIEESMTLESTAFEHGTSIPARYTCDGDNISPSLRISGVPERAVSLALVMHDPDVPTSIRPDGNWDHWLAWNIPAGTTEIPEGQEPRGAIGKNTGGNTGYQGPCPPDREHRYFFKLFALDTELNLSPDTTTKSDLESAMEGHILSQTELVGRYNRQ